MTLSDEAVREKLRGTRWNPPAATAEAPVPPDDADTSRRTPVHVDHLGVDSDPHPLVSVPVAYFPPRVTPQAAGSSPGAWTGRSPARGRSLLNGAVPSVAPSASSGLLFAPFI